VHANWLTGSPPGLATTVTRRNVQRRRGVASALCGGTRGVVMGRDMIATSVTVLAEWCCHKATSSTSPLCRVVSAGVEGCDQALVDRQFDVTALR